MWVSLMSTLWTWYTITHALTFRIQIPLCANNHNFVLKFSGVILEQRTQSRTPKRQSQILLLRKKFKYLVWISLHVFPQISW